MMQRKIQSKLSTVVAELKPLQKSIERLSERRWGKENSVALLGNHPLFAEALTQIEPCAHSDDPVLLIGETGVGKELFARAIYLLSKRNEHPFLSVNCANFRNESLLESRLFGHTNGSFTGAVKDHRGVFEQANGGVLFLDEVETLPLTAQGMLLRVLETGEIRPLGSENPRHVNVRVISAANQDLLSLVRGGLFRKDLYYRLNVLMIRIPPLRERGDDWRLLIDYYLEQLNKTEGKSKHFSEETLSLLEAYRWPGNIRELINIVKAGFYNGRGEAIGAGDIREKLDGRLEEELTCGCRDIHVLYRRMVKEGESFWKVIREPYLNRDLNRNEVKTILKMGLKEAGSYKRLIEIFHIEEKDYKKFMNFLRTNRLK